MYSVACSSTNLLNLNLSVVPNLNIINCQNNTLLTSIDLSLNSSLIIGTQILNKAFIYFDFNTPVVTNTAVSDFVSATSIASNDPLSYGVIVAPNPTTGYLTLTLPQDDGIKIVKIYNVLGEIVYQSEILKKKSTQGIINTEINLSENKAGIYLLRVFDEHENVLFSGKVVKE